jgi:hypothetical protein
LRVLLESCGYEVFIARKVSAVSASSSTTRTFCTASADTVRSCSCEDKP